MQSGSTRQSHIPSTRDLPPGLRLVAVPAVVVATLALAGIALYQTPLGHNAAVHQAAALAIHRGERLYLDVLYPFGPGAALFNYLFVQAFGNAGGLPWLLDMLSALTCALLMYLLTLRFTGSSLAGFTAGLLYPAIHYSGLQGLSGEAEALALMFFLCAAASLFIRRVTLTLRVVLLGVCFGLSLLTLPSGVALGIPLGLLVLRAAPEGKQVPALVLFLLGLAGSMALCLIWIEGKEGLAAFWTQWSAGRTLLAPDAKSWAATTGLKRAMVLAPFAFLVLAGFYGIWRGRYGPIGYLVWAWLAAGLMTSLIKMPGVQASWLPVFAPLILVASAGIETLTRRSRKKAWKLAGRIAFAVIVAGTIVSVGTERTRTSEHRAAFRRLQPVIESVRSVGHGGSVFIWDWAPQIFAKADRSPANGVLSLAYLQIRFTDDDAIFDASMGLVRSLPDMILVRRSIPGEGGYRRDGMAGRLPLVDPVMESFLLDYYWLLKKEAGYEIFILTSNLE